MCLFVPTVSARAGTIRTNGNSEALPGSECSRLTRLFLLEREHSRRRGTIAALDPESAVHVRRGGQRERTIDLDRVRAAGEDLAGVQVERRLAPDQRGEVVRR